MKWLMFFLIFMIILFLILIVAIYVVSIFIDKTKENKQDRDNVIFLDSKILKKREREERKIKKSLGLRPDENYLCFSSDSGAGKIICKECGHIEEVVFFTHSPWICSHGRQCPNCHSYFVENVKSINDNRVGKTEDDCLCPKCGTIVRRKEESFFKGNDNPLFCPHCHSPRLKYFCDYIT